MSKMLMSTLVLHSSGKETGLFIDETKKKFEEYAALPKPTSL